MNGWKRVLWLVVGAALGVGGTLAFQRAYDAGGFVKNSWDMVFAPPVTATKVLILVTALIVLAAFPLAVADLRSDRRFRLRERALRQARPTEEVTEYEGPEGRGLQFRSPDGGRLLLLRPPGGLGAPREVEEPAPEVPEGEPEAAPAPDGDAEQAAA